MTRDEALSLLHTLIVNQNLINHHLAAEAVMKALANYFKLNRNITDINEEKWGLVGLLHDADYDLTRYAPEKHTVLFAEKFGQKLEPDVLYAIRAHNFLNNKVEPKSLMDWSLYCADELTGIIVACALVLPDKKLALLTTDFVLNKLGEKSFAKGANREQIKSCGEKLGIPLRDFVDISLKAMQQISMQLEL